MDTPDPIRIPLRNRAGEVVAHALIDHEDAAQAAYRWYISAKYVRRRLGKGHVFLHRELLGLGREDGRQVDHIDRDPLNCRRSNLRVATNAQNMQNQSSYRGSTSPHRGVSWHKRDCKWQAYGQVDGRLHHLGYFAREDDAAAASAAFRATHMPYSVD
jgi:hypothetical protein